MESNAGDPRFGAADLTNCERELIHLPGSIQPHGALLVLDPEDLDVRQASANVEEILGVPHEALIGRPLDTRWPKLADAIRRLSLGLGRESIRPLRFALDDQPFHAVLHAVDAGLVFEIERRPDGLEPGPEPPAHILAQAVEAIGSARSVAALSERVVERARRLLGYDRVMVYRFDRDGHGEIVAESRSSRLEDTFLGLHYPATDIPQRARQLYLRNRVRMLVNVDYDPAPVLPRNSPATGDDLDMSLCQLRSMSPLHLQYLRNMGVTATLVVSLVEGGRLWGLIACHHYSARHIPFELRAAAEILGEAVSTRLTALECASRARVEMFVRRMETRVIEAMSTEGDWRWAVLGSPRELLEATGADGAALCYDGQIHTLGEAPSASEVERLLDHVARGATDGMFEASATGRDAPELADLAPVAAGVLAVELDPSRDEYLMWFRGERIRSVRWAGNPREPHVIGDDPMDLSPRRSFAVWNEIVRGAAEPWTSREMEMARVLGSSLRDIVQQVRALELLLAEENLRRARAAVQSSVTPTLVADADGGILAINEAYFGLFNTPPPRFRTLLDVPRIFSDPYRMTEIVRSLLDGGVGWRGELDLEVGDGTRVPVALRADAIPGVTGRPAGYIVIFTDLTDLKIRERARQDLERELLEADPVRSLRAPRPAGVEPWDRLLAAVLENASQASQAAEATSTPVFEGLQESARRASELARLMRNYATADRLRN